MSSPTWTHCCQHCGRMFSTPTPQAVEEVESGGECEQGPLNFHQLGPLTTPPAPERPEFGNATHVKKARGKR